jgi:hypothetical protein
MLTIADPALCFIVSMAMILLYLYSRCQPTLTPDAKETLERYENILQLFLQQFATHWYLPRFVLGEQHSPPPFAYLRHNEEINADIEFHRIV